MDILAALRQEEGKLEEQVGAAQQQVDTVRSAIKLFAGMNGRAKVGGRKRVMSAAARAKISKATKERWAKLRAARAKGKR